MFTQDQIEELFDIIDNQVIFFIANNIGSNFLSKKDRKVLQQAGFDLSALDGKQGYVDYAFKFGMLSEALSDERAKNMKYSEFKKFVNSGKFVPLNSEEKATIFSLKNQSLADIKGLGNRAKGDVQDIIDDKSQQTRNWYEKVIREEGKITVEMRESVKDMKSRIGHRTGNWNRDFDRICETVLHQAYDEGRASNMVRESEDGDPLVYKDVKPGACKHCVRLYTTNGIGSKPKVFRLSTLRQNGSNVGRKVKDWKPIVGDHPFGRCDLHQKPKDYIWSDEKGRFIPDPNKKRKVKRQSKVGVKWKNE